MRNIMANMSQPPVLVGERIFWLCSGSGLPKPGTVKWIGHLPEMGQHDWTVGIELDEPLPYGGIDGAWGQRTLFRCKQKHGLIVPLTQIAPASNLKISKQLSDSSKELALQEKRSDYNQHLLTHVKKYANTNEFQEQKKQQTGTNTSSGNPPQPVLRKKHQNIVKTNKHQENERKEKINLAQKNVKQLELKYKNDEEINKKSIIFADDNDTENEKFYDCYNKFDTLTAEEKATLLLNKCIESRGKKRDVLEILNNGNEVQTKRMLSNHHTHHNSNNIIVQTHQSDSNLEGITVSDTVFAARRQVFYKHGRSHSDESHTAVIRSSISSNSSRREKGTSGIFSFFRWFKKDKEDDDDEDDIGFPSVPSSPKFIRSQSSSCGSVDTLFSTATASSFAFIHPAYYRPFGSASQAETRIADGPETYTYRQRVKERDKRRELEKDISLKKKYNLFGSSTLHRSADDVSGQYVRINRSNESLKQIKNTSSGSRSSTISRKKRKAPLPPVPDKKQIDYSLPSTLEHLNKTNNSGSQQSENNIDKPHHRRTVSESAKDKKAGAYCHVRGKRKAPPPPILSNTAENTTDVNKNNGQSNHSLGKKKRPAPPPPTTVNKTDINTINQLSPQVGSLELNKVTEENDKEKTHGSLSPEEKERLLKSIAKLQVVASRRNSICTPPSSPSLEPKMAYALSNDSLKLERGVLKPTKSEEGTSSTGTGNKFSPPSPVSPRPWYKRHIMKDHGTSNGKIFDKKKEKVKVEDWMPEVGVPRTSMINNENNSRFNIFSKSDKNEEKRKSQISMLVNISELDREAAEIVQKEHAKERAILAAEDAKFYLDNGVPVLETDSDFEASSNVEVPKRSSARELISLFNAITNVTKVTVNTSFFSKEGSSLFSREGKEKRFSFGSSTTSVSTTNNIKDVIHTTQEEYNIIQNVTATEDNNSKKETEILESQQTYLESPGKVRRRWNKIETEDDIDENIEIKELNSDNEGAASSRVTIEEIDEFDIDVERSAKTQALYEANKLRRHHSPSPSIPTIVEMSESVSSVATSPGSTSTRSQKTATPTTPTVTLLQSLSTTSPELTVTQHQQQNKRPTSIWACPQCTLENPRWRVTCEACDMWKPPLQHTSKQKSNNETNNLNQTDENNGNKNIAAVLNTPKNTIDHNETEAQANNNYETNHLYTNNDDTAINENSENILKEEKQSLTDEIDKDIEELRKARVAFFHKVSNSKQLLIKDDDEAQNESKVNSNNITNTNIEDEHTKLKEMLKDLKHSLPKRHKKNDQMDQNVLGDKSINDQAINTFTEKEKENKNEEITPAVKNFGAIKKIPQTKNNHAKVKSNNSDMNQDIEKAEIYLVKTEKIIEDIKIKKQPNNGIKPEKVSTSVQTNAFVRKTDSPPSHSKLNFDDQLAAKPPLGRIPQSPTLDKKDLTIPITVEEYTIKDGILYTSLSKETKKIGTGTFELILPRDFAGIKATKTSKDLTKPLLHHVYANIPNSSSSSISSSGSNSNNNIEIKKELIVKQMETNNENAVEKLTEQLTQPKGLADFKAGLETEAAFAQDNGGAKGKTSYMMNTVAVNRLLRRLETAISKGQLKLAAKLAKELAQLKINCSVTRHKTVEDIVVDMYVEDKLSHQGPIPLMISQNYTVAQLKMKVEKEFEIPVPVQRWILGKQLAVDDSITLVDLGINTPHCPIFLYLVAPEMGQDRTSVVLQTAVDQLQLDQTAAPQPPPPPENIKRGGWFYNDEEDKYSFCEDSESEISGGASRVETPLSMVDDEDAVSEYSENEMIEDPDERPPTPPERQIDTEQAHAVNLPPAPTGTLALGWKCELCTLVNSPTRPGCAACTNPRPVNYHVPHDYQVSDHELERMKQEELQKQETAEERLQNYQALVDLENADLVLNTEEFECPICFLVCAPQDGVMLRDCLHTFCRACLVNTVQFNDEAEVKCPYRDNKYACDSSLLEREIKALVPPDLYEQHLAKSVAEAENKIGNAFHCKTPDCPGWCIFEDNVNEFLCPVCRRTNCLTCQAIHTGINCKQFQERAKQDSETNADARRTNEMLEEMVDRGEAMKCPTCQVILMKKWGCDWLRCSMCKTEICWVTRGPRWGPQGKGDTTGGCQCGVNGIKCHPKCNYCH